MSAYRVRPGAIPKGLKIPERPLPPLRTVNERPPIRNDIPIDAATSSLKRSAALHPISLTATPQRARNDAAWLPKSISARNAAKAHPYAQVKLPRSLRAYDLITALAVPGLFLYLMFVAPGGEKSELSIVRRWTEGLIQDVRDWWNKVPRDAEVDPEILLQLERSRKP
ncbi:hypothetical protein PIIN_07108 [Serendipita indica DSM 11827]|uniref:Uncharacterized protein n=1 Tax=Serendipita indica (strain DSM 11827) TaxID=1109443 RepID=G4TPB1_SERID|nr:hypothetical protein PIIN_07108 [Serendipita indica DSM 11827]